MPENTTTGLVHPQHPPRQLKIETEGDFWKGVVKPKIRLTGRWLERAGFSPGGRVHVTCLAPGVIQLRSAHAATLNAGPHGSY